MNKTKLYLAFCCLGLLASLPEDGQVVSNTMCSPCKLDVGHGLAPLTITYELVTTPDKRQLIRQLLLSRDGKIVQKLKVHGDVALSSDDTPSFFGNDINADGFQDIEFVTARGAANAYADYWLYKPSQKQFPYLGNYPVFTVNPKSHLLRTYERNGYGGRSYSSKEFAYQNGKVELMRSETQEETKTNGLFQLTIKERVHGVLKTITKKTVRPPS